LALVVGLGNPGADYAGTRHNAGWWVVERLVRTWGAVPGERRSEFRTWEGTFRDAKVTLMEPLTWMNLSGEAVAAWRNAHGLELAKLLVIADDVYLPVGHLRLRASGSSGGHRGLDSIERALESRDYARLRFGVGETPAEKLREHVLDQPSAEEQAEFERSTVAAAEAVEYWLAEGVIAAMNRINRKVSKEVSEP
jgi:peptidyl-tRNA hydrolase, PTH1 family